MQVIPSARSSWDVIGEAIGHNLSQNLPGAVQQGYQRQTGLNAIDQLQNDLANSNGDVTKMLPAIARAYTLNPSLERSGIAEKLIPLAQRKSAMENMGQGKGSAIRNDQQERIPSATELVPPRPTQRSQTGDPQGVNEFQLPYGPEEIMQARQIARQNGYLPEIEERIVNDMHEFNKVAQNRRDIELQNYQQAQQQRRDTLENQKLFETYLNEHSPEFATNPDELELALKAAEKYQNEPSFAARNAKVKEELRPYQAAKNALDKALKRPLTGNTPEQKKMLQDRAQYIVEQGQKPQLQLMIAKNGHGENEEAFLLNPLPEEFESNLNKFNKFVKPLDFVKNIDPDSQEFVQQLARGTERLENQKQYMTDFLSENITSGTYKKPGTNLLLTRKDLMQKGLDYQQAEKVISDAIKKGNIKLDPQQQIDYQKLAYPPLTGDTYSDTIMNNILFPITGKE